MVRILPLPKGVSEKLYANAMRPFKPGLQRLKARKIMLRYGPTAAYALRDEGPDALDAFSKHGKSAVLSVENHGLDALASYRINGAIVFKVLPHLEPQHIAKITRVLGQSLYAGDYRTLKIMIDELGAESVKSLIASHHERFKRIFQKITDARREEEHGRT